jgi:hypothetical protein
MFSYSGSSFIVEAKIICISHIVIFHSKKNNLNAGFHTFNVTQISRIIHWIMLLLLLPYLRISHIHHIGIVYDSDFAIISNGITFLPNLMKIHQSAHKILDKSVACMGPQECLSFMN